MTTVIAVVAILVGLALTVLGAVVVRRKTSAADAEGENLGPAPDIDVEPMTGLQNALEAATDSSGTKMRDRLDGESDHVDDLRVPDDTGPLLRRALDHVEGPTEGDEPPPSKPTAQ